ncbi:MAG: HEAT repeat domain-containing protein [Polyangiaceae bacterium]
MAASPIDKITTLLGSEDGERQVAAAIILGELRAKGPKVVNALCTALDDGGPLLQRHALGALTRIGAKRAVERCLELLSSHDPGVRAAAVEALVSGGESVVPRVEKRLPESDGHERQGLDAVLARLGGKEAFSALLAGLEDADDQAATAAAVALRAQVKGADARARKSYLGQLDKALARQQKRAEPNVAAIKAALKIIGYLEEPKAVGTLQSYATSKKQPAAVRQEALIALRFTLGGAKGGKLDTKLVNALVAAAQDDDRALAQTALITLAGLELPARTAGRLHPLLEHPDADRAKFVIDMLAHRKSADAAELLVRVLAEGEMRRARLAADALRGRADAVDDLVVAVTGDHDKERSRLIGRTVQPLLGELKTGHQQKLINAVTSKLEKGEPGWQTPLELIREANPDKTAKALKALYDKLKRRKPAERATAVLRMICRGEMASHDDRYELASRLLAESHRDTSPAARRNDDALAQLERLLNSGYDIVKALGKDRGVDLDTLYYVGFHFIEQGHPAGEDLLNRVIDKGGRKKIAKMAKNKLSLTA